MDKPETKPGSMPVGFINSLAQHPDGMNYFCSLSDSQKEQIVSYIQISTTGEEAKARVHEAVNSLCQGELGFLGRQPFA